MQLTIFYIATQKFRYLLSRVLFLMLLLPILLRDLNDHLPGLVISGQDLGILAGHLDSTLAVVIYSLDCPNQFLHLQILCHFSYSGTSRATQLGSILAVVKSCLDRPATRSQSSVVEDRSGNTGRPSLTVSFVTGSFSSVKS